MDSPSPEQTPVRRRFWHRLGLNFLTFSILGHLIFGIVAAYFIVQVIQPKRKMSIPGGAGGPAAPARALERQVQMKKQAARSAPPAAARVTTKATNAKVALPPMPLIKVSAPLTPTVMPGMTGHFGSGSGSGNGNGTGAGGGGGGGGLGGGFIGSIRNNGGLTGTFYDLKQTTARQPTGMDFDGYSNTIRQFVRGNFNPAIFSRFYKASRPLYATQIFTPNIKAELGPQAFGVEKEVQPRLWVVYYKGTVVAPESGTFHFSGVGDDVLLVKFNNKWVLDSCWCVLDLGLAGQTYFKWGWQNPPRGVAVGPGFTVEAGKEYPIEVLIGEQPGIASCAALLIRKEGVEYAKDEMGNPVTPVFRTADVPLPELTSETLNGYAPHADGGPVWKVPAVKKDFSVFDH